MDLASYLIVRSAFRVTDEETAALAHACGHVRDVRDITKHFTNPHGDELVRGAGVAVVLL